MYEALSLVIKNRAPAQVRQRDISLALGWPPEMDEWLYRDWISVSSLRI